MTTLRQMQEFGRLHAKGWRGVAGPMTDETPIGGPLYAMNARQDMIVIESDGSIAPMERNATVRLDDAPLGVEGLLHFEDGIHPVPGMVYLLTTTNKRMATSALARGVVFTHWSPYPTVPGETP